MSLPPRKIDHRIPINYFDDMHQELHSKLKEEEQFEQSQYPLLHSISKNKDFYLPENYFENFNYDGYRLKAKSKKFRSIYKYAASVFLLIGLSLIYKFSAYNNSELDLKNTTADVDFMMDAYNLELEELDLIDLVATVPYNLDLESFEDEDLIEYLLQEFELEDLNNL